MLYLITQESSLVLYSKWKENQPTNQKCYFHIPSSLKKIFAWYNVLGYIRAHLCVCVCESTCVSLRLRAEGLRCGTRGVPGKSRWVFMCTCVSTSIHTSKQSGTSYAKGQHSSAILLSPFLVKHSLKANHLWWCVIFTLADIFHFSFSTHSHTKIQRKYRN